MSHLAVETIRQPEPTLRPDDLVERAAAMREWLREHQAATDEAGTYSPDTHEMFRSAGFYRILQPRRFGGYEFDLGTFMRVIVEVARGCPGTGWNLCLAAGHAVQLAGLFEEQAQLRALSPDGEFAAPLRPMLTGTADREPGGGWRVEGTWAYCSGAPYSTHALIGVRMRDSGQPVGEGLALLPREGWVMLDDWREYAFGMRGSGSNSITTVDGGYVIPDEFLLHERFQDIKPGRDTPGYRVHGNPLYAGKTDGYLQIELTAVLVGCAYAALDEYERIVREKKSIGPNPVPRYMTAQAQRNWGIAAGKIRAAEDVLMQMSEYYHRLCEEAVAEDAAERTDTTERHMVIQASTYHAVNLTWEAVELLFRASGTSEGGRNGTRMQRYYRDMSAARTNAGLQAVEVFAQMYAQEHFGLEIVDSFI